MPRSSPCGQQKAPSIGPLDKRLRLRRCEQCRIRRTKCEGGRPCVACKHRLTVCRSQAYRKVTEPGTITQDGPTSAVIDAPEGPFISTTATPGSLALVQQFVGDTPTPITDLFSAPELLRWSEEDSGIRTVLSCIGNVYATRGLQLATVQKSDVLLMEVEQREIYDNIQKRLQQPSPHLDKSLLHLAVFFCLLQMMSSRGSKAILRALEVLDQVAHLVVQPRGARGFSTRVDKSVLLLFRVLEGLGCLMRDSRSVFTEAQWHKTVVDFKKLKSEVTPVDAHVALLFECHCTFLAAFTDINAQSNTWLNRESEYGAVPGSRNDAEPSYANHLAVGQKIIQQASELLESLQELEDDVKDIKSSYDTSYDMFMSTSLNFKISALRLFAHPLWQNASVSKQALHESDILEYAHSNLEHIEKRMPHAGVEAFIYIDQLLVIGLEMRHSLDRLRVISLLDTIKSRGFGLAEVYIEDLQLAWKAVPSSRSSTASGLNAGPSPQ